MRPPPLALVCCLLVPLLAARAEADCMARAVHADPQRQQLRVDLEGKPTLEIDFVDLQKSYLHTYDCAGHWLVWHERAPGGGYLHAVNLETGARKTLFEGDYSGFATSFDGRYVAIADPATVRVLEIDSMRVAEVYPATTPLRPGGGTLQARPEDPDRPDGPGTLIWTRPNKLFFGNSQVGGWWKLGTWSPGSRHSKTLDLPFHGNCDYWLSPDGDVAIFDNLELQYVVDPADPPRRLVVTAIDLTTLATVDLVHGLETDVKVTWGQHGAVEVTAGDQGIKLGAGELRARLEEASRSPADAGN